MQSYALPSVRGGLAGAIIAYPLGSEDVSISCELSAKLKQTGGRRYFQGQFQQIAQLELADGGLKVETTRTDVHCAAIAEFACDGTYFSA